MNKAYELLLKEKEIKNLKKKIDEKISNKERSKKEEDKNK